MVYVLLYRFILRSFIMSPTRILTASIFSIVITTVMIVVSVSSTLVLTRTATIVALEKKNTQNDILVYVDNFGNCYN